MPNTRKPIIDAAASSREGSNLPAPLSSRYSISGSGVGDGAVMFVVVAEDEGELTVLPLDDELGEGPSAAKDGEEEDVKDAVNEMQESVMRTLKKVFDMVSKQLDLAMKLFKRMKNDVEEAAQGESVDSSSSSSSDSDSK